MSAKPTTAFLDFETLGPNVGTKKLEALVDVRYHDRSEPAEIACRLAECEIAIVNKCDVGGDAIRAAKRLKLIALTGTGSDNVDVAAAKQCGVAVANTRGYCSTSLAQHVFALILALTRQLDGFAALVRRGAWSKSRTFAMFDYPVRELSGRTLGLVGSGTLGQAVGRLGECFDMRVSVAARIGTPRDQVPAGRVHFDDLLERADVLSLHCPLNAATKHLIGAPQLKRMKRNALLINTARGGLIDSEALAAALRARELGGAGIDVLARQRALDQVTENISDFLLGGTLRRVV